MSTLLWFLLALILQIIFYLTPVILMIHLRHIDIIRKRGIGIHIILSLLTLTIASANLTYLNCFLEFQQECYLFIITIYSLFPIIMHIFVVKSMHLVYENARVRILFNNDAGDLSPIKINFMEKQAGVFFAPYKSKRKEQSTMTILASKAILNDSLFDRQLTNIELMRAIIPSIILAIVLLCLPIGIFFGDLLVKHGCPNKLIYVPIICLLALSFISVPVVFRTVYFIEDGLGMRNEILVGLFFAVSLSSLYGAGFFIEAISPSIFGNGFWVTISFAVSHCGSVYYPVYKAWRHNRLVKSLRISREDYKIVTSNPALFAELKKKMRNDHCLENALFIEDLERVRISNGLKSNSRSLLMIYHKYIKEGAVCQINISHESSIHVKHILDSEVPCGVEIYESIEEEILVSIYENTYQRYIVEMNNLK